MSSAKIYDAILSLARKAEPVTRLPLGHTLSQANDYTDKWYFVKKNGRVQYAYFARKYTLYIVWPKTMQVAVAGLPIAYLREKAVICNAFTSWLEINLYRVEYVTRL